MSFGDLKVQDLIYEDSSNNEITVVIADLATKANPTFTGTVTVPTPTAGDNSTKAASTAFVVASFATKASPTFTGTINGADLILSGNLTVSGTQTIINTNVLQVEDKHIEIGKVSSPSDTTADGGGIILKASSDRTFLWVNSTDAWTSSEHIQVASGKTFIGDGSTLTALNATNLASGTVATARLGTGTASSSNFLRGDGSWQTIATDKIEEGNTSVETVDTGSDGHVKITTEGTERVKVDNNGNMQVSTGQFTVGTTATTGLQFINDGTFGTLHSAELKLRTVSGERFRIGTAGQLGIGGATYGTSGQVLTSGGSGAAPSWTTISAAPTITATVDGSISANDAVVVKSTGNIEKITRTNTEVSPTHSSVEAIGNNRYEHRVAYDKQTGYVALAARRGNVGPNKGELTFHKLTGTNKNPDQGSQGGYSSTIYQINNKDCYYISICSNNKGQFVISYKDTGDQRIVCKAFNVSSDGVATQIFGNYVSTTGQGCSISDVCYVPDNDLFVIVYREGSVTKSRTITVGSSSATLNAVGTDIANYYWAGETKKLIYDEFSNKLVYVGWYGNYLKAVSGTISGTSITWNSPVNIAGNNSYSGEYPYPGCDPNTGLMVVSWMGASSQSDYAKAVGFKVNGNSFTAGTETTHRTAHTNSHSVNYNHAIQKLVIGYGGSSSNTWGTKTVAVNSSTLALTFGNAEEINAAQPQYGYQDSCYMWSEKRMMLASPAPSSANYQSYLVSAYYGTYTTNLTATNFIGFSSAAYSNGDTGTVNVTGNTSTQSGLTAGSKYYTQIDGTLAATADDPSVEAGIALSSTKLLIKG